MKLATTSSHNYLDVHPEVYIRKDLWKESNYFVEEVNCKKRSWMVFEYI